VSEANKSVIDITDGIWWTRDRNTGELEVVKVKVGYLSGYPTRKGKVVWRMSGHGRLRVLKAARTISMPSFSNKWTSSVR
jgi:hypothetical protein